MSRNAFFKAVAAVLLSMAHRLEAVTRPTSPRRYRVPPSIWYEDEQGNILAPDERTLNPYEQPSAFPYLHIRTANTVDHKVYKKGDLIVSFCNSWGGEDLILAMTRDGYRLRDAIVIYTVLCERCVNSAAYDYGLSWGYPRTSAQFKSCPSRCEYCSTAKA